MVEYGIRLRCDKCLAESTAAWGESPTGATPASRRRQHRLLFQDLLRLCRSWRATPTPEGERVHLCPICQRDLALVGVDPPAAAEACSEATTT